MVMNARFCRLLFTQIDLKSVVGRINRSSLLQTGQYALSTHLEIRIVLAQSRQCAIGAQIRIDELISPIASALLTRICPQRRHVRVPLHIRVALEIRQRLIQERLDVLGRAVGLEIVYPHLPAPGQRGRVLDRAFELREAGRRGGGGVVPVHTHHVDRAARRLALLHERGEPVHVRARLQHGRRAQLDAVVVRVRLHELHVQVDGVLWLQVIPAAGLGLTEAEEGFLALGNGLFGVGRPFLLRGAFAVVLRDEFFGFVPVGRWGRVPIGDPADVRFVRVGERNVTLVVGLRVATCGCDDATLARAAARAGYR